MQTVLNRDTDQTHGVDTRRLVIKASLFGQSFNPFMPRVPENGHWQTE